MTARLTPDELDEDRAAALEVGSNTAPVGARAPIEVDEEATRIFELLQYQNRIKEQHQETKDRREDLSGIDGYRYTDAGNAQRLIDAHGNKIRYVAQWGRWLAYDGRRWVIDPDDVRVSDMARSVAQSILARITECPYDERRALVQWGSRSEMATGISGTLRLARAFPEVVVEHEQLDDDPMLLNVENGTVDLSSGTLRTHRPSDLITKMAAVSYEETAAAPTWNRFVERVLPDDDTRRFVQRLLGYTLTGHVHEHVLPILHGGGINGKSVLVRVISSLLGDYAVVASKDLLIHQHHEPHPTSRTVLFRARLAHSGEIPAGAHLNEAQVKELTGADRITARRMREDHWEFNPTHTFLLHANHRPQISGTDLGIWRRLLLIPFTVTIPADERDETLADRIIGDELPGVLHWLLDGLADYHERGLVPPDAVRVATDSYRTDSDTAARFMAECGLIVRDGLEVLSSTIAETHRSWCDENGEKVQRHWQHVAAKLKSDGATPARRDHGRTRFWRGVGFEGDAG